MAKAAPQPITAADISEYLLTQDDFALELAMYHKALELKLLASHGGTYEDSVTKKHRQFDLRIVGQRGNKRIALAAECKNLKTSYPLLVSRIPRSREESFHQYIYSRAPAAGNFMPPQPTDDAFVLTIRDDNKLYPHGELVGKSTVQIGRTEKGELRIGDGETYEKWAQALASATDLIADSLLHHKISTNRGFITATFPVLVVADKTLWAVDYYEDGSQKSPPHLTDAVTLFTAREYAVGHRTKVVVSHLHIYTRTGMTKYLEELAWSEGPWLNVFPTATLPKHIEDA